MLLADGLCGRRSLAGLGQGMVTRGMTSNDDTGLKREASEQLERLGLSAYAARTFVALVTLEGGTAKDVSEVVDVPRTRVYDAAEELVDQELATIESSTPQRFRAVSIERALLVLSTEYADRIDDVISNLEAIGGVESSLRRETLWLVTDADEIERRIEEFLSAADETVLFATAGSDPSASVVNDLVGAADRGVAVSVAGVSQSVEQRLEATTGSIDCDERPWDPETIPVSTVLIVDDERSLLTLETADSLALWSAEEPNNLLVFVRALLGVDQ